ncbi:MAG: mucoidy inhibitor MuiA family protein [Gemmataceae bacterium]|nr:mucoidy inhibitor MuiA family protein [Gemmataceae bacterium]
MRRRWLFASAGVLALGLVVASSQILVSQPNGTPKAAGAASTAARSKIVKVTVYPNSALVTREVEVPAGKGIAELVVSELPMRTVNSSLYSEGTNGIRVLSTRFRTQPVFEDTREDVRKLEDEIKKLQLAAQKIQADIESAKQNMMLLTKLEKFTEVTTVQSTEKGGLNGDTVITMAKYVMEQRAERSKEVVALQQQLLTNTEQAEFAKRKLQDLTRGSTRTERDAIITVDRENGGGTVRLNYLVDSVSWSPQYKLRAGAKASDPVEVDYLAGLRQQSGEDWTGVDLTLSTAQPMLNAAPPTLAKLEVTVVARASVPMPGGQGGFLPPAAGPVPFARQPQAELERKAMGLRSQAVQNYSTQNVKDAVRQINEAAAYEQNLDLQKSREEILAAQRSQGKNPSAALMEGPSVTYHLKAKLSVPSRNDEQVIEVTKLKLEPKYYHKAVPVLTRHVYRQADLTNKSNYVLLPGEATMYQGQDFVGRMAMPLVAIGEELTAGFGVDPQVQVQREMLDKTKSQQGGNQILNYKYRILVSNFKNEAVKLQVWDRLPHAEKETAGITLVKATPEISKDGLYQREGFTANLLRWDLEVEPNVSGERAVPINYEFRLELDRNMAISGLLAR